MKIEVLANASEMGRYAAEFFVTAANKAIQDANKFSVALSGGKTPRHMYKYLVKPEWRDRVPWEKVHIFWGDERCIGLDDLENNAYNTFRQFLEKVPIDPEHIHRIQSGKPPPAAAQLYEAALRAYFGSRLPAFDLIFLGLGENGHTASLFPGSPILKDAQHWVAAVYVDELQMYRISFTTEIINQARNVVYLVSGQSKASILRQVIEGKLEPEQLPAQLIKPVNGELYWLVDEDAASLLTEMGKNAAIKDWSKK